MLYEVITRHLPGHRADGRPTRRRQAARTGAGTIAVAAFFGKSYNFV